VQHWWLPPVAAGATGQGVRTRISDDVVWLAYCAVQYIETTGDAAVLDEQIPFLEGRALQPEEHDAFFMPGISDETATLFEHCARGSIMRCESESMACRYSEPATGTTG
jgi:cyclic beta-1,2-glucan synthetase